MLFLLSLYPKHPKSRRPSGHQGSEQGFTLIELLVTALISSIIVSGLLYLTNELLTSDTRESTKTETQRDLDFALDYMVTELREATFVYPNAGCLKDPDLVGCNTVDAQGNDVPYINSAQVTLPADAGDPVLAFWRQEPLETTLVNACQAGTADPKVPCIKGSAYSLVVYAFNKEGEHNIEGKHGITRYSMALTQDTLDDYASPIDGLSIQFRGWPHLEGDDDTATFSDAVLLADFIDESQNKPPTFVCPTNYTTTGVSDSFYACIQSAAVNTGLTDTSTPLQADGNQDVVIRLRGNAAQGPIANPSGISITGTFLPTLESQVMTRGVLNRQLP